MIMKRDIGFNYSPPTTSECDTSTTTNSNSMSYSSIMMRKARSMDSMHLFHFYKVSDCKENCLDNDIAVVDSTKQLNQKASRFSNLSQQQQQQNNIARRQQQCSKLNPTSGPESDCNFKDRIHMMNHKKGDYSSYLEPNNTRWGHHLSDDCRPLKSTTLPLNHRDDNPSPTGYYHHVYHRPFSPSNHLSATTSTSVSRPTSVVSLSSLDLQMQEPGEQMAMTGPIATFREILSGQARNIKVGPLIHLIVFSCLLFGTLSDVFIRMNHFAGNYSSGSSRTGKIGKQKSRVLGSAMISSITEVLSPILPFAGGVDLRRDEKWKSFKNYLWIFGDKHQNETVNSVVQKVSLIPRGGGALGSKKNGQGSNPSRPRNSMILSATEPFLSAKDIADMTLRDVSFAFRYIIEAGRKDFHLKTFLSRSFEGEPVNTRMKKIVQSIEDAVEKSRGIDILPATTSVEYDLDNIVDLKRPLSSVGYGDIDALRFCAAMRLLAEWRLLRQVPPGYKGYAVGMSLGHKDVVQNVAKIESAAHEWIEAQSIEEAKCDEDEVCKQRRSPTLRQLLIHEIDTDIHPNHKLPRLKEKSSAMGLLWVRRQLHYQTSIFDNIISVPKKFPSVIDAVSAAYTEVYGKLHGWAVQKIFNYSFQSAPSAEDIFRHMNPHRLEQIKAAIRNGVILPYSSTLKTEPQQNRATVDIDIPNLESLDLDDMSLATNVDIVEEVPSIEGTNEMQGNAVLDFFQQIGNDIDNIGRTIGSKWDEAVCNFSNIFKNNNDEDDCENRQNSLNTRGGGGKPSNIGLNDDDVEEYVINEMKQDAKEHILAYLNVAKPMLSDLAGLFDEMNMDDPTKV